MTSLKEGLYKVEKGSNQKLRDDDFIETDLPYYKNEFIIIKYLFKDEIINFYDEWKLVKKFKCEMRIS